MGSLSNYAELKVLDHVVLTSAFTVPTNIYVALSTADPTEDGSGIAEPAGGSYARVVCNTWDAAAARATENTGAITFAEATGAWGTITHWALFDAITAGNMLAHGALSASKVIGTGDNCQFAAGDIDIAFSSGGVSDYLANALLDHIFKTSAYTQPSGIYYAACDTTVVDGDTGSTISEPSGGSYARKQNDTHDAAAAGATQNTGATTFVTATASWGTILDVALLDALTTGNLLIYAVLDASKAVGNGDTLEFAAGAMDITLT